MTGTVAEFDSQRGTGKVASDDGAGPFFFHCTAIADGSRAIDPGAPVEFEVVAAHLGRWEAVHLHPRTGPA
ncbi:MAG: cold-shock protein [Acidimicrobiales bacterium]